MNNKVIALQKTGHHLELYEKILDSILEPVHVVNRDYEIVYANKAFYELSGRLGYEDDFLEKNIFEAYDFLNQEIREEFEYVFKTGEEFIKESPRKINDKDIYLRTTKTPIFDELGKVIKVVTVIQDVTESKKAEDKLRETNFKFKTYIMNSPMAIMTINNEGKFTFVNPAACILLGYDHPKELIGLSIKDTLLEKHRDKGAKRFYSLQQDGYINDIESKIIKKDGTTKYVLLDGVKLEDDEYIAFIKDISEQKKLEKRKQQQDKLKGVIELAGSVCHNMSQPLMAMQGWLDILRMDSESSAENEKVFKNIDNQLQRMTDLLTKIMNITRYETKDYLSDKIIDLDQSSREE